MCQVESWICCQVLVAGNVTPTSVAVPRQLPEPVGPLAGDVVPTGPHAAQPVAVRSGSAEQRPRPLQTGRSAPRLGEVFVRERDHAAADQHHGEQQGRQQDRQSSG